MVQVITQRTRRRTRRIAFALIGVGILVCVLWPLFWQIGFGMPGNVDFYVHQSKYRSIVTRAKRLPLALGTHRSTRLDGLTVDAARDNLGAYEITITTADFDHAGIFGYVFSDTPQTPRPDESWPNELSVGGDICGDTPFVNTGILGQHGHWWSVYNNLL